MAAPGGVLDGELTAADNQCGMGDFFVRDWLAARLRIEPDQLDLAGAVRGVGRGQEARYDIDGGEMATVLVTWPAPAQGGGTSRTIVATLPDGRALNVIDGSERVVW